MKKTTIACLALSLSLSVKAQNVTFHAFTLTQDVVLDCTATNAIDVFDVQVPQAGWALARAELIVKNTLSAPGPTGNPQNIYFWNATVLVGGNQEYAYGLGDDLCAGAQRTKYNFGYGELTASSSRVRVPMYSGASPCTAGAVTVKAGSTLTVAVENAALPKGTAITYASWFKQYGVGADKPGYFWGSTMSPMIGLDVTTTANEMLLVFGLVEGTPETNPNATCGFENATLAADIRISGPSTNACCLGQQIAPVPASSGNGHLVMAPTAYQLMGPGTHRISLFAGSNIAIPEMSSAAAYATTTAGGASVVTTGRAAGDGALFVIKL